jgi:hypothetical protein
MNNTGNKHRQVTALEFFSTLVVIAFLGMMFIYFVFM